ncbi:hypothetical protein EUX98_g8119 [Antrodiella citrinella]|uniref:Cytochrome P450 n=1 Tax=Antrodiella citrinella TaxID=2447956 RepID=A0A4S4MIQ9_9APHY|nr:hypothetical protein EUX98_g8119 [Antrodiella citrinella]
MANLVSANGLVLGTAFISYLVYKRYEPSGILATFSLQVLLPGVLSLLVKHQYSSILNAVATAYVGYWTTLLVLILGYRLSPLHPLAKFPGPIVCKVSKWWLAYQVTQGKVHEYHRELHARYGDVVRIGPNELSFATEDAIAPILKDCPKGPYFNTRVNGPNPQLDGIRDMDDYARRRKAWNRGMSVAALKDYEELLRVILRDLLLAFENRQEESLNLHTWLGYMSFDMMGEMAFSRSFHNVKSGTDATGMVHAIEGGVMQVAWVGHVPWIQPLLGLLGKVLGEGWSWKALQNFGAETVRTRMTDGSSKRDLFHYLMDEDDLEAVKPQIQVVAVDGILAIIAGSDTAAVALSHTFYFLIRNPRAMKRLREEIDSQYPGATDPTLDFAKQAEMPYLNACINEAIRLYPPVLSGLQRKTDTGKGGIMLGSHYIPDGTQVSAHLHTIQRDPRYFHPLPDDFWPDRFLVQDTYELPSGQAISKDVLVHNRNVFVPFSAGVRNCVGKNVAVLEMRAVLCAVVQRFELSKAPDFDLDNWERDLRDLFITSCGPLMYALYDPYPVSYLIYKRHEPSSPVASLALLVLLPGLLTTSVRHQFTGLAPAVASVMSKMWAAYIAYQGTAHLYYQDLHTQYGDIVRIGEPSRVSAVVECLTDAPGPNELSFRNVASVDPILKDSSKGEYFITRKVGPVPSLDGIVGDEVATLYAKRRTKWNRGTSVASMKNYEEYLRGVIRDLLSAFEAKQEHPLNLARWLLYASFDFMGEMALSKQFKNVEAGADTSGMIHAIDEGVSQLAWVAHVPWIMPYVGLLQFFTRGVSWKALQRFGAEAVRNRLANNSGRRDLFHHLMDGDDLDEVKPTLEEVASDGILAIVAGSDTSATALSHTFYFMLRNPRCLDTLRAEVVAAYPGTTDTTFDFAKQAEMPYLNACINEALRLYPPVLTGLQRKIDTGTGGSLIGPYYIPDGTHACAHNFSMQRDPRYFYPLPDQFWPDRWLVQDSYELPSGQVISKEKLIHNREVFVPFSLGMRSCAGKSIAMLEMRAMLCALLQKYDFAKAPNYNMDDWEKSVRDIFVTSCGPLMVTVKARF